MLSQLRLVWSDLDPKLRSQAIAAAGTFVLGSFVLRLPPKLAAVVAFAAGEVAGYQATNAGSRLRAEEEMSDLPNPLEEADLALDPLAGVDETTLE